MSRSVIPRKKRRIWLSVSSICLERFRLILDRNYIIRIIYHTFKVDRCPFVNIDNLKVKKSSFVPVSHASRVSLSMTTKTTFNSLRNSPPYKKTNSISKSKRPNHNSLYLFPFKLDISVYSTLNYTCCNFDSISWLDSYTAQIFNT